MADTSQSRERLLAYLASGRYRDSGESDPAVTEVPLREWVWGLGEWGKPLLVAACCEAARMCALIAVVHNDSDALLRAKFRSVDAGELIHTAEAWLNARDQAQLEKAAHEVARARPVMDALAADLELRSAVGRGESKPTPHCSVLSAQLRPLLGLPKGRRGSSVR